MSYQHLVATYGYPGVGVLVGLVGIFVGDKFYADSEKSKRGDAKTRPVDKYKLVTRAIAESFLRRNTADAAPQMELGMELPRQVSYV